MSKKSMLYLAIAAGAYYLYTQSQKTPAQQAAQQAQSAALSAQQFAAQVAANPLSAFGLNG